MTLTSSLISDNTSENTFFQNKPKDPVSAETNSSHTKEDFSGIDKLTDETNETKTQKTQIKTNSFLENDEMKPVFHEPLPDFSHVEAEAPPHRMKATTRPPPDLARALVHYSFATSQQSVMLLLGAVSAGLRGLWGSCFHCRCSVNRCGDKAEREQGAWFDRGQVRRKTIYQPPLIFNCSSICINIFIYLNLLPHLIY